jgi:putative endonuclease
MPGRLLQMALRSLEIVAGALPWNRRHRRAGHLRTGQRGEDDAYFWLRRAGYVMVARNWRSSHRRGELDFVGWEGAILCFIEVKARSGRDLVTAEAAVDFSKQQELRAMAVQYLRRLPSPWPEYRFDVVTVYYDPGQQPAITLLRSAFPVAG